MKYFLQPPRKIKHKDLLIIWFLAIVVVVSSLWYMNNATNQQVHLWEVKNGIQK